MALRASYYGLKKRILDKVLGDYDTAGVMTNKELTDAVKHTRTIRLENASSCTFSLPEASANNNEHSLFLALMSSTGSADVNVLAGYKITNAAGNIKTIAGAATGSFDTSTGKFTITADGPQRTLTIIANAEITV